MTCDGSGRQNGIAGLSPAEVQNTNAVIHTNTTRGTVQLLQKLD